MMVEIASGLWVRDSAVISVTAKDNSVRVDLEGSFRTEIFDSPEKAHARAEEIVMALNGACFPMLTRFVPPESVTIPLQGDSRESQFASGVTVLPQSAEDLEKNMVEQVQDNMARLGLGVGKNLCRGDAHYKRKGRVTCDCGRVTNVNMKDFGILLGREGLASLSPADVDEFMEKLVSGTRCERGKHVILPGFDACDCGLMTDIPGSESTQVYFQGGLRESRCTGRHYHGDNMTSCDCGVHKGLRGDVIAEWIRCGENYHFVQMGKKMCDCGKQRRNDWFDVSYSVLQHLDGSTFHLADYPPVVEEIEEGTRCLWPRHFIPAESDECDCGIMAGFDKRTFDMVYFGDTFKRDGDRSHVRCNGHGHYFRANSEMCDCGFSRNDPASTEDRWEDNEEGEE